MRKANREVLGPVIVSSLPFESHFCLRGPSLSPQNTPCSSRCRSPIPIYMNFGVPRITLTPISSTPFSLLSSSLISFYSSPQILLRSRDLQDVSCFRGTPQKASYMLHFKEGMS